MKPESSRVGRLSALDQPEAPDPDPRRMAWARLSVLAGRLSELLFSLWAVLMLTTPSWRSGTFAWLPLVQISDLGGLPASLGVFVLVPFVFAAAWSTSLVARFWSGRSESWNWGRRGITAPLMLLTVLGLLTIEPSAVRSAFIQVGGLVAFWVAYFYLLNYRPYVVWSLAIVVLVQTGVAFGQFVTQADVGLVGIGELPLDPSQPGIIVLFARGQRWLRSYGLTAHPNLLGAMLTAVLLLLLPALERAKGCSRATLSVVFAVGLLGLLLSFSRAATLAFAGGLLTWLIVKGRRDFQTWSTSRVKELLRSPWLWLFVAFGVAVAVLFGDLVFSRVADLDSTVEAISINQRFSDWRLALHIIAEHPIRGVGLGQYIVNAGQIAPFAVTVHNVPLLVTAELGIGGALALMWLTISGLRSRPAGVVPWIAVLIVGFFDVTLWLSGNWQTAILFSFVAANLSRDITAGPQS